MTTIAERIESSGGTRALTKVSEEMEKKLMYAEREIALIKQRDDHASNAINMLRNLAHQGLAIQRVVEQFGEHLKLDDPNIMEEVSE